MSSITAAQKRFEQPLLELSRTQSLWTVFNDFLDFSLLFMRWWDVKPSDFSELEKKYPDKRHAELMAEAYLRMGDLADGGGEGFADPFGNFFMEHLSNNRTGQFFTPEELCELNARLQIGDTLPDNATVADPCCGSGRMLLAVAKINRKVLFYAMDIDLTCCKMTVINFLLNSMAGEVAWMNSLSLEHWKSWHIKRVMDGNGMYRPYYWETGKGTSMLAAFPDDSPNGSHIINPIIKSKILKKCKKQNPTSQLSLHLE